MMRDDVPDMGGDYFQQVNKALNEFHNQYKHLKPLYMLIKVDVDADIVHNQTKAGAYAVNHCKSFEYELADWYYPDDEQYPYIAK